MEDFIVTPEGKIISPSLLTFPLKHSNDIIESQVVQTDLNEVNVYIIRGERFNEQDEITLRESFKPILGNQMIVNIICTEKIHSTSAFKKRFVINKLGRDYIETAFNETK
jgi:phenylacetate-CoA ligase